MDEWVNKVWYLLSTENYSHLKKKKILTHDTVWMKLGDYTK